MARNILLVCRFSFPGGTWSTVPGKNRCILLSKRMAKEFFTFQSFEKLLKGETLEKASLVDVSMEDLMGKVFKTLGKQYGHGKCDKQG